MRVGGERGLIGVRIAIAFDDPRRVRQLQESQIAQLWQVGDILFYDCRGGVAEDAMERIVRLLAEIDDGALTEEERDATFMEGVMHAKEVGANDGGR